MSEWNQEKVQEALKTVFAKAATDKSFRELAMSNPAEAVKAASGVDLPAGFTVRFVENGGADATFVLPDFVGDSELSDEQLEAVAGGKKKNKNKNSDPEDDKQKPLTIPVGLCFG
ncbi:NHLP leader peptide family RiPP precursor [Paenibacillus sp. HJGM_3]|uniref:NHLP leader peptide family RiPP precursor n=1 Tax=Paenibacillus sp. HJGM_3 TaxID=3379816 RepID=UPI00385C8734